MKKLRPFLPGVVMAAFLLLTDGCASTDPNTVKTRGVYTTLAVEGQSLDLPYSQYVTCKSFGPGQTPAAVVTGYGDFSNGQNQPQPFTLQLLEAGSGAVLFSKESEVYYGRVATLPLSIRKSGGYKLKLFINNAESDSWDFTVWRDDSGTADSNATPAAYAKGIFSASLELENDLDAFHQYEDTLSQLFLNAVQRESGSADQKIFAQVTPGDVVIEFTLHDDGRVESPTLIGNSLSGELGQFFLQALIHGSPYKPWPAEARQALGRNSIKIKATFSYN
jgi:hypothetical protein